MGKANADLLVARLAQDPLEQSPSLILMAPMYWAMGNGKVPLIGEIVTVDEVIMEGKITGARGIENSNRRLS